VEAIKMPSGSVIISPPPPDLLSQAEGHDLNEQTNQLNELMKQVKKTQFWISEREKKLYRWEILMNETHDGLGTPLSSSPSPDLTVDLLCGCCWPPLWLDEDLFSPSPPSSSNERESLARHIEKMKNLEVELDRDLTLLGDPPPLPSLHWTHVPCHL
jgi:hypothetical protein